AAVTNQGVCDGLSGRRADTVWRVIRRHPASRLCDEGRLTSLAGRAYPRLVVDFVTAGGWRLSLALASSVPRGSVGSGGSWGHRRVRRAGGVGAAPGVAVATAGAGTVAATEGAISTGAEERWSSG